MKRKMLKLIGNKPKLNCYLDKKRVELLWDTGSMISLVDRGWLDRHFPDKTIYSVAEFLGEEELKVCAVNSSEIEFDGVALMDFTLKNGEGGFVVPVLVASEEISEPILGYNVIEYLILNGNESTAV